MGVFKPALILLLLLILWHANEVSVPTSVVVLGRESPPKDKETPNGVQWVDSDDGSLSLRLCVTAPAVATDVEIEITAQIRNTKQASITVLRPFGDGYAARASRIKIWNDMRRLKYSGPKADYDLNKDAFAVVAPGEMIEDKIKLTAADFAGIEAAGTYTLRYDYSYNGDWDATAGIRGAWRGTIASREVQVMRKTPAAGAE